MQDIQAYYHFFVDDKSFLTKAAYATDTELYNIHKFSLDMYLQSNQIIFQENNGVYIIVSKKYEVHLAILPSGDYVFYTINHKSQRKANYSQAFKFMALVNLFKKLEV